MTGPTLAERRRVEMPPLERDVLKATVTRVVTKETAMAISTCQKGLKYFEDLARA